MNNNHDFSLKLSSFNIEILFKLKKENYNINKNKPFDPLLNQSKDIEEIKNILKSNHQEILNFLYFNIENIEKILYNIDEIIYFDFDYKNNIYFLKINKEEIEIEQKNEMAFLFYISLLINYNKNVVNFSFSIQLINKINSINSIDESNIYKNLLISKIILELINFYRSNQIFEENNNIKEQENLNKIEINNINIIDKYIKYFEELKISQKDFKLKNIDLIYAEIINIILKSKDYDLTYKLIEELDLENINITKTMFNEISKTLSSKGKNINEYNLTTFDDLFNPKKIEFYYILFKYILKNPIYIYDIEFLNEKRKTIINIINLNQNQSKNLSNNNNKIINQNFKYKVIYVIKFLANSDYELQYINLKNNNILNSKLSFDSETNHSSFNPSNPLDYTSFKEEQERSRRNFSMYDQNIKTPKILIERYEENQINIKNNTTYEELRIINSPLDSKFYAERQQENSNNSKENENINLSNIEVNEKDSLKIIIDDIENILKKSSITLSINFNKENTIEYKQMIYNEGTGIIYEKFKNYFSEEQEQKLVKDYSNNLFNNYKKLIDFFEKIKEIAKTILSQNQFLIEINIKEVDPKNNSGIKNIISEYNLVKPISLKGNYKDENILNKDNYEGFTSFSKEIANNPFQISSIKKKTNTNSISTIWAIIDQTEKYQFISFKKLIGKHQKLAEKIRETNISSFLSSGYNELFKYNLDSGKIIKYNFENIFSFFINKNEVIVAQKKKFSFLNKIISNKETEYSCRNLFKLKDNNNYIICDENGIFYESEFFSNFSVNKSNKLYEKEYRGGIKINDINDGKDVIVAITSNRVLPKGENKIIFFNSNSKKFMDEVTVKNYSFNLSENNCALMKIPKHENYKLLLCACKKYIKDDKNGILLLKLKVNKDNQEIFHKFYNTQNFEVYCFCPILQIVENKFVFEESFDKVQIKDTEYFFVGGFDLDKGEGLIKLYKVIYNDDIEKIKIEYIQDIIVGRKISKDESESFYRFKGPISCMIQSSRGGIFITCYDGGVYLFSKPDIDILLKENYNILK